MESDNTAQTFGMKPVIPDERKPITIHWVAPNGKEYKDTINMTLDEYVDFVNGLLEIKKKTKSET